MRALLIALSLAVALGGAAEAKSCKDPQTGRFVKCSTSSLATKANPAPAGMMTPAPGVRSTIVDAPKCKTGKPCGNSCIAKDKVCHK
jgi:hypothetical protein